MRLTFYHNACCTYESGEFKLLTDPWFFPGSFGSWTHDPPISIGPAAVADASAIYISHVHEDHCQAESLAGFRRTIPIYCLGEPLELVPRKLRGMGFKNIIAMEPGGIREFGPFTLGTVASPKGLRG